MSLPTSQSTSTTSTIERSAHLSIKEIGDANRRAQLDGVAAGTCAGFLSGFMSTKALKMSRNIGLLSGLVSGVFVGYIFTQESLKIQLNKALLSNSQLRRHLSGDSSPSSPEDGESVWGDELAKGGERGVGGMEQFHDKYQTTRGDH